MTAKEYLSQYRDCVEDIKTKRFEIQQLLEDATMISPAAEAGGRSVGNISDKVGKKAALIADLEREIDEECAAARELRRDIRASIAALHDGTLRRLLTYRYICGCTWERIAVKMNYSYKHVVHFLHPRALAKIGDTMPEKM